MAQKKLPSMQWYPGDWRKEPTVQALDYFDRGVWFELLNIMWDSPERGRLVLPNGSPMPDPAIARTLSLDLDEWLEVRTRLVDVFGTASEGPNDEFPDVAEGVLFSRRQVRDEEIRLARAKAGRKGGKASGRSRRGASNKSNEREAKPKQTPKQTRSKDEAVEKSPEPNGNASSRDVETNEREANVKQTPKQNRTSSSSSSSSTSSSTEELLPPAYPPSSQNARADQPADSTSELLAVALRDLGRGEFRTEKQKQQVRAEVLELRRRVGNHDDALAALRGAAMMRDQGLGPFDQGEKYTPGVLWRWKSIYLGHGEGRNERDPIEAAISIALKHDAEAEWSVPLPHLPDIPAAEDPELRQRREKNLRIIRGLKELPTP